MHGLFVPSEEDMRRNTVKHLVLRITLRECEKRKPAHSSDKEHTGDALASSADEGRGTLRKALVRRVQP
jgi:hypothetical protein